MGIATKPIYLGALVTVLGICAAFWAFAVSADAAKETTITVVEPEKGSTFNFVDNVPKSKLKHGFPTKFSPGDQVIFTSVVEIEGKRVGRNRVVCTATTTARKFAAAGFVCDGIAKLSNGTLVFAAMLTEGPTEGAITGGTGTYAGAHGSFVSKEGKNSSTTTVTLVE
jgi:hypothetical protein